MSHAQRPLRVVLSFSPWEKRRERAQRKGHFFSCFCLQVVNYKDLKAFSRNVKKPSTGNRLGHSTVAMENKFLHVDSILLTTFYQAGFK